MGIRYRISGIRGELGTDLGHLSGNKYRIRDVRGLVGVKEIETEVERNIRKKSVIPPNCALFPFNSFSFSDLVLIEAGSTSQGLYLCKYEMAAPPGQFIALQALMHSERQFRDNEIKMPFL